MILSEALYIVLDDQAQSEPGTTTFEALAHVDNTWSPETGNPDDAQTFEAYSYFASIVSRLKNEYGDPDAVQVIAEFYDSRVLADPAKLAEVQAAVAR